MTCTPPITLRGVSGWPTRGCHVSAGPLTVRTTYVGVAAGSVPPSPPHHPQSHPMLTLTDIDSRRFWAAVHVADNDCWEWTGSLNPHGYGAFNVNDGHRQAHRVAYEIIVGPIPDGLQIDHLCRNPP